jgi:hypothetical protein
MNETPNNDSSHTADQAVPPGAVPPPQPDARQAKGSVLTSMSSAFEEGARKARASAEAAVPKVKAAVSGAAYWCSYGVAYAAVFSAVAIKEIAPAVFATGCRDGANAGRASAEKFAANLHTKKTAAPHAPTAGVVPPDQQPQPSAA